MTEQLKPCPLCGSLKLVELKYPSKEFNSDIKCIKCGCKADSMLWNNRPYENKLKADAVREAHDKILFVLKEQYTTTDQHCYEVLGMISLHADKLERGED